MSDEATRAQPVRASVLAAAAGLEAAAKDPDAVAAAMREATTSLEFHLDTLARELGRGEIEPRLLSRARAVDSRLREALLAVWGVEGEQRSGPIAPARLIDLAHAVRAAGEGELDLVFEELRDITGSD